MAEQPSKTTPNQDKLDFLYDYARVGGDSTGGKSLQQQIKEAPEAVLWLPLIPWDGYKTSVLGQLAYNAKGIAQANAELAALRSLMQQIVTQLTAGVPVVIDYDLILQGIKDSMPIYVPQTREEHEKEGN